MSPSRADNLSLSTRPRAAALGYRFYGFRYAG